MDCSKPDFPVHHQLLEFTQTHVYWVEMNMKITLNTTKNYWISICRYVKCSEVKSLSCVQLLSDPMDYSLPGSSVHGILKARVLEWGTIFFSRGSSRPRHRTQVSHIAGRCFTVWTTREVYVKYDMSLNYHMILSGIIWWKEKWSHSVVSDSLQPHGL